MKMNNGSRREFLKAISVGMSALILPSCMSRRGTLSETSSFTFVQLCDTQLGMGGYEHDVNAFRAAVAQINALKPDFVVICGDLVGMPNAQSFADFKAIKAELAVPCYCVPGNHDVGNEPTRESLLYYRQVMGEDYYSFEHRGYLFISVNSQLWKIPVEEESKKHDSWLTETLEVAANKRTPVFIIGHYPLFLEKPEEVEEYMNLPLAKRQELLNLFEKRGVVAVLGGHTHRLLINEHQGMQFVNGETTSKNFDKRPLGFRLWYVEGERPFKHEFVPVEGF
ncbi:metallophosphoesterase [Planctomycetota bacterium]